MLRAGRSGSAARRYLHRWAVALVLSAGITHFPAFSAVERIEFGYYAAVGSIPLGFSFDYYGQSVNKVVVNRYGLIEMDSTNGAPMYNSFPLPIGHRALYVLWDSLDAFNPKGEGQVHYETQGVAPHRRFIVQWSHFKAGLVPKPVGDFQIILDEGTGSIKYQYRNGEGSATVGRNATIGIEGPDRQFIQIGYRDEYAVGDQQAILFTPLPDTPGYRVDKQADFSFVDLTLAAAPEGHFILPQSDEVTGEQVAIEIAIAATEGQDIASVDFFVGEQWLSRQLTAPWRTSWSTTTYEQGRYPLKVVITNRNNRATTLTKTVFLKKEPLRPVADYFAEITEVYPPVSWRSDQPIMLRGKAWVHGGKQAAKHQPLMLHLRRDDQTRTVPLTSDAEGYFSYQFMPTFGDNGSWHYTVTTPGAEAHFAAEKSFRVEQLLFSPTQRAINVSSTAPLVITSEVTTHAPVTGIYWALRAEDQPTKRLPTGVSLHNSTHLTLAAGKQADLTAVLTILPSAGDHGQVTLTALSPLSGSDSRGRYSVNWQRVPDRPQLVLTPAHLTLGLARGDIQTRSIEVKNIGTRPAERLQLTLIDDQGNPAPEWIFISSPTSLGSLAQGEAVLFELTSRPPLTVAEGDYRFRVLVNDDRQLNLSLPVQLAISQQGQSRLAFHLSDIYTATMDETGKPIAGVAGATIVLQNEAVLSQLWTLTSNEQGEAMIEGISPGTYLWRVSAEHHDDRQGRIVIGPGVNEQSVFLDYQTVTIHFEVIPTTIKDRYELELTTTFQTYVPAPVLVISPAAINLAGLSPGTARRGSLTITNQGLVLAENIGITLPPSDSRFTYHFTQSMPKSLLPGEQVTLNYQVIAKPAPNEDHTPKLRSGKRGSEACSSYQAPLNVGWHSICASGQGVTQQSQALFYELTGTHCSLSNVEFSGRGEGGDYLGWLPLPSNILTTGCSPHCDSACCQPQGAVAGDR